MAKDWLDEAFRPPDKPRLSNENPFSLRVFRSGTELKEAIHEELTRQLLEAEGCPDPECGYRYTTAVGFLVHEYLHVIREGDNRVKKAALDKLHDVLNPPKSGELSGALQGVLTEEEREQALQDPLIRADLGILDNEAEENAQGEQTYDYHEDQKN